jgi:DNA-binding transcriptional ArsR family regulator
LLTDKIKNQTKTISTGETDTVKLKGILALSLMLVLSFSLAGLLQRQREADTEFQAITQTASAQKLNAPALYLILKYPLQHYELLTYSIPSIYQGAVLEKAPLPDNFTRTEIYSFINANPGVQFRAICGGLGLSIGVVQFHLAQLQKSGLITSFRKGRYKRFFEAGRFSSREMETIAWLRLDTVRNIVKVLLEKKQLSHRELAVHLKISSQGLTWQMNRLLETRLIQQNRNDFNVTYTLGQTGIPLVMQAITITERN